MSPDEAEAALARSLARLKEVVRYKAASSAASSTRPMGEVGGLSTSMRIRVWLGLKSWS